MPKLSLAERLDVAIKEAAANADLLKISSRQAAAEFHRDQPGLVDPFVKDWIVEKLASIIGGHRTKARRAANPQLAFEEALGFKHLPAKIEMKDGKKIARADATMGALRILASHLGQKETPAQKEVQQAIILMSQYTADNQRITWGEVVKREAEKASKKQK
jgi:hypothetical protein